MRKVTKKINKRPSVTRNSVEPEAEHSETPHFAKGPRAQRLERDEIHAKRIEDVERIMTPAFANGAPTRDESTAREPIEPEKPAKHQLGARHALWEQKRAALGYHPSSKGQSPRMPHSARKQQYR